MHWVSLLSEYTAVRVYPTTDLTLPAFDNTRLVAINTCPTDGILRYTLNKRMYAGGRAMALEAGAAAHEVFAAHRLYSLKQFGADFYKMAQDRIDDLVRSSGIRLYGSERYDAMVGAVDDREDDRTRSVQFAITALNTGQFYDDPGDKRRTLTNIEEMCIGYIDKFDWRDQLPAILEVGDQPTVGIEIPIDVTIEYTLPSGEVETYRFIGKADGLHYLNRRMDGLRVHENKTASRLGDAWEQAWHTNHQPTGYMIGLSAIFGQRIRHALMLGSCLPLPKAFSITGFSRVPVEREDWEIREWFDWFLHTVRLHNQFASDPINAPKYTHSCNRYFRPCAFIPFCASPPEDRGEMIEEMYDEVWSPLNELGDVSDE